MRGLRMPNRWSVTHYLFGYDFGFVKRGLWGDALGRLFGGLTNKYFFLAAIALVIFLAIIVLLARLILRLSDDEQFPFAIVFLASPAIAMLAHLAGYLEQIGYLWLLLLMMMTRRWPLQVAGTVAAAAVLPFVHEAAILWFGPLSMLILVLSATADAPAPTRRFQAMAAVAVVWMASTGTVVWLSRSTDTAQVSALRDRRTQTFDLRPRQDAFNAIVVPVDHALADMRRRWSEEGTRLDMVASLATFAPAAVLLAIVAARNTRAQPEASVREVGVILIVLAIAAPLLLHIVAWDRHRWNGMAAFNAGVAALVAIRARPHVQATRSIGIWLALAVAFWSLESDPVFFDGYSPTHPPFVGNMQFLLDFLRSGDWNMWIPAVGN